MLLCGAAVGAGDERTRDFGLGAPWQLSSRTFPCASAGVVFWLGQQRGMGTPVGVTGSSPKAAGTVAA